MFWSVLNEGEKVLKYYFPLVFILF